MKPACASCGTFFKPERNSITVLKQMPGQGAGSGWVPYELWKADLSKCHSCGKQVVHGWASGPYAEHYQPDFQAKLDKAKASSWFFIINDC